MAERHFLGRIAVGDQGDFDRFAGYRVDQLLETTQQSATQSQPQTIPWQDPSA